jgi:hypothetical protein
VAAGEVVSVPLVRFDAAGDAEAARRRDEREEKYQQQHRHHRSTAVPSPSESKRTSHSHPQQGVGSPLGRSLSQGGIARRAPIGAETLAALAGEEGVAGPYETYDQYGKQYAFYGDGAGSGGTMGGNGGEGGGMDGEGGEGGQSLAWEAYGDSNGHEGVLPSSADHKMVSLESASILREANASNHHHHHHHHQSAHSAGNNGNNGNRGGGGGRGNELNELSIDELRQRVGSLEGALRDREVAELAALEQLQARTTEVGRLRAECEELRAAAAAAAGTGNHRPPQQGRQQGEQQGEQETARSRAHANEKAVLTRAIQTLQLKLVRHKLGMGTQAILGAISKHHVRLTSYAFARMKGVDMGAQISAATEHALAEGASQVALIRGQARSLRQLVGTQWLLKAVRRMVQLPLRRGMDQWRGVLWYHRALATHATEVDDLKTTVNKAEGERKQFSDRLRYDN